MVRDFRFNVVSPMAAAAAPVVAIAPPAAATPFPLSLSSLVRLVGNRGHFLHRLCLQLLQILSGPKVVWQRWQERWTLMRIFFSTRSASGLMGDVHSPGSNVKPYFANRARALSSCIEPYAAAVIVTPGLAGLAIFCSVGG